MTAGRARRALPAATLAIALLVAACGSPAPGSTAAAADIGETAADVGQPEADIGEPEADIGETAPASAGDERRPTAEQPLRVLMAGDSLLADLSLAIASTVQDGGRAVARLAEEPSVPRDDATRRRWRQRLARFDPEVIVILIGVWEAMATGAPGRYPLGSTAWERTYRQRLLDPYLELLTSRGAKVVWIGMPPVLNPRRQRGFTAMNRAVRHLAEQSTDLTYVPGDRILARPNGSWTAFLPGPQGNPQRVRRVDTTHLCAWGAVRLARPVLRHLQRQWAIPLAPNWPYRNWRWVFPRSQCPPR